MIIVYFGPSMSVGTTQASNCSSVTPFSFADSRSVVPFLCAFLAMAAALSYPTWRFKATKRGKSNLILSFITGDKHERLVEELIDSILICGNADDAVINKGVACSSDEIGRSENVGDHDGLSIDLEIEDERKLHLVDVELEMAVHTASGDSHVVAHNLRADHRNGLDLGRVNLAGHDGRSGLVLGKVELAETASRS